MGRILALFEKRNKRYLNIEWYYRYAPSHVLNGFFLTDRPRDVLALIKEHRRDIKKEQKRMLRDHQIAIPTSETREEQNLTKLGQVGRCKIVL